MIIDEFALKAMVEQEDDDILISKVRSRSFSSSSQNDKLINCSSTSYHYRWFYLCSFISPFALLHDQFSTWSEFETSRSNCSESREMYKDRKIWLYS